MYKGYAISFVNEEGRCEEFVRRTERKDPLFACVIATTETAKIPGISAAGAFPEITDYTPPADVELLFYGRCKCIDGVPVTPDGIPTPALITMSALKLGKIPCIVMNGGLRILPKVPFVEVGGKPGRDIRGGVSVENVEEAFMRSSLLGRQFSQMADYLVVGESIPGGTTTALAVLLSMGVDARRRVSSSMPGNPHDLKIRVVEEAMRAAGISFGSMENDPFRAISAVGDPMIPVAAGIISGAAERVPVLMAGGTQMCAVLRVIKSVSPGVMHNLAIGTTRWIVQDRSSDICGIASQIGSIPIIAADLDFSGSRFSGLRAYEMGVAKEGVGAGGSSIAAFLKSGGSVTKASLLEEIERNYGMLVNAGQE